LKASSELEIAVKDKAVQDWVRTTQKDDQIVHSRRPFYFANFSGYNDTNQCVLCMRGCGVDRECMKEGMFGKADGF
jgi:uncharacterized Fe-S radical SAM superfamily protein PflX